MDIENLMAFGQTAAQALTDFYAAQPIALAGIIAGLGGGTLLAAISIHAARIAGRHNQEAERHLRAVQALAMEIRQLSSQSGKTTDRAGDDGSSTSHARVGASPVRVSSLATTPEAEVAIIRDNALAADTSSSDEIMLGPKEVSSNEQSRRARAKHLGVAGAATAAPSSLLRGRSLLRR